MSILFVAAVEFELDTARKAWADRPATFLCGGVGSDASVQALEATLAQGSYERVVDIGIAGSYRDSLPLGAVVHVTAERHGDSGGTLLRQPSPWPEIAFLPTATGNTLQELDDRYRQVEADVETMEGAAFFEVCLRHGVPFAEIRAVSNRVGERNHAHWDIPLALRELESTLCRLKTILFPEQSLSS